jgi:hypothetical protein
MKAAKNEVKVEKDNKMSKIIYFKKVFEPWIIPWNNAASHRTYFEIENDQNKPHNDIDETFLWSF